MATIAERNNAQIVSLTTKGVPIRGYDFVPSSVTSEQERDFIFRSLFPIGLNAFVQEPSEAMERDISDHLFGADHLLVMRADGSFRFGGMEEAGQPMPIAFRMWKTYNTPIGKAVYLAGMCVSPQWQGTGIGTEMTRYVLRKERPNWVFTITQNPIVKQSMDRATRTNSYPHTDGYNDTVAKSAGDLFAQLRGVDDHYDPDTFTLANHYGGALYGRMPVSNNRAVQRLFDAIDRRAGDAYLLLTQV